MSVRSMWLKSLLVLADWTAAVLFCGQNSVDMTSLSLKQMEEACRTQKNVLLMTDVKISTTLDSSDNSKAKHVDDLRELSGKIKVFLSGKLKQLEELITNLKEIEDGEKPQTQPPLYINDVQGYYDLTMIEARHIHQRIKELWPNVVVAAREDSNTSKF